MAASHPPDEFLADFAAGAADGSVSLFIASHLALCPHCQDAVSALEHLGGLLLEGIEPAPLGIGAPPVAGVPVEPAAPRGAPTTARSPADPILPRPLARQLGVPFDRLPWRRGFFGLREMTVMAPQTPGGARVGLLMIDPGRAMPRHTHDGNELTLVLSGGFGDGIGHYRRGDVAIADPQVRHQPVADPGEACVCLTLEDAPVRVTGPLGFVLNLLRRP